MTDEKRHQRELKAALKQIQEIQARASRRWRLDVPLTKLAVQGLGFFGLAFLVGLGLGVLFNFVMTSVTM